MVKNLKLCYLVVGWNSEAYSITLQLILCCCSDFAAFHGGIRFAIPPYNTFDFAECHGEIC